LSNLYLKPANQVDSTKGALALLFDPSSSLRRFLSYVRPHLHLLILATLFGILKFSIPIAVPVVAGHIVDRLLVSDSVSLQDKLHYVNRICGLLLVIFAASGFGIYFRHFLASKVQYLTILNLRVPSINTCRGFP